MTTQQATFSIRGRNPDVLTCIANLSNDEVFTSPELANRMLDKMAAAWADSNDDEDIWSNPDITFLDPFTKSGVFLREITSRLTKGLEEHIPDLEERVDHILTKQVFGMAITELTAMLARRSLYCSKWANGPHSIAKSIDDEHGNIWFDRTEHTWIGGTEWVTTADAEGDRVGKFTNGKCKYCGASQKALNRGEEFESHAYALIHTEDPKALLAELFGEDMKFDVIIGNPPYQLDTDGHGNQARPIYQLFVEQAKKLEPKLLVMITPARWFSGGMGLGAFRKAMLADRNIRTIVDFPKLYDAFPGVKIRGGVAYFVRDSSHSGPCTIQTMWDDEPLGPPSVRYLDAYDILVRRNEAIPILEKVRAKAEPTIDGRVSSQKPFGLATNFKGKTSEVGLRSPVKLYANQSTVFVERTDIPTNVEWVDEWKVLMTRIQGTSASVETKFLSKPLVTPPGTACTETYLVAGHFATEDAAIRLATYLRTRFVRFLVSLRKPTQDALKGVYSFVPVIPLDREWTDAQLYERYGLTEEEVKFIESLVAPHDDEATWKTTV
ncbi:Eco57I restriction-modification methylase domain-containing protein [Demequina aestuarii]|uniref:Eco57I restriction-modification methylase domain-containing protein n=1 Tax=Demequina aestuarii TaxID=327095 RepID=UPI0007832157|nr:Eco57I restriction-modification methylase domain-containing protein [Demequina aestuarii]